MYDNAYSQAGEPTVPAPNDHVHAAATRIAVREALSLAAERSGGVDALCKWIRRSEENQRVFWSVIYPKLLPLKVDGEVDMGTRLAGMVATWVQPQ